MKEIIDKLDLIKIKKSAKHMSRELETTVLEKIFTKDTFNLKTVIQNIYSSFKIQLEENKQSIKKWVYT